MTPLECKRLQSMELLELPTPDTRAYAALGNAINVKVAQLVAEALLVGEPQVLDTPDPKGLRTPLALSQRVLSSDAPADLFATTATGRTDRWP